MTTATVHAPEWVFNLARAAGGIERTLSQGVNTRIFAGDKVMLSVVTIKPNTTSTVHSHPEEQWGVLLDGRCVRIQGAEEVEMGPGSFWHTPGGVAHGVRTGAEGAKVLDVFAPPREAYRKPGRGYGT